MISYSTDALNVKSLFYNKSFIVYVEGQDDIIFWDKFFSHTTELDYRVEESPGGKTGLLDYMDKIVEEDAQIIVACDSDYNTVVPPNEKYIHERIIRTYGYSIENSMYCPHNINQLIRRFGRINKNFESVVSTWYNHFLEDSRILLIYDLANHIFTKGIQVFGDKCVRFLTTDKSSKISETKVNSFIHELSSNFTEKEITDSNTKIINSGKELRFLFKGHFLTNAVLNFIKETIKKETSSNVSINLDSLYAMTLSCVGNCNEECDDIRLTKEKIQKSIKSLE